MGNAKRAKKHVPSDQDARDLGAGTDQHADVSEAEVARKHEQLAEYMDEKGLRSTAQRRLVTDLFFRAQGHFTIDEMLAMVRQEDPRVGYATVYRTLKLLKECGLANERQFKDGITRFELAHEDHHDHLICLDCNLIVEFEDPDIERLQDQLARRHGFSLVSHKHELYGRCQRVDCANRDTARQAG